MGREYEKFRTRIVSGSIVRTLLWLGLPPLLMQLVNTSYNLADSIWLSRLRDIDIAVPRQVWPLIMFVFMIGMGFRVANTALISQLIGAKRYDEADRVASNFLYSMILLGLCFSLILFFSIEWLLVNVMKTPPEIFGEALAYARIAVFGIPFGYAAFAVATILQAVGDTRTPTVLQSASAVLNIVLDPFLIFGWAGFPAMGVMGAAVATLFSRVVTTIAGVALLIRGYRGIRIEPVFFDRDWFAKSLRIGAPIMVVRGGNISAFIVLQRLVNSFGVVAAAAYSIGFIVISLSDAMLWGFSTAISVMVGQNLGAGRFDRAWLVVKKSLLIIIAGTSVGALIVYAVHIPMIAWFTKNPLIMHEAAVFIELFAVSIPFFGAFFTSMAVGNGSGHTMPPSIIGLIRLWVLRVGLAYLTSTVLGWGLQWVWISMSLSNIVGGLIAVAWLYTRTWMKPVIHHGLPGVAAKSPRGELPYEEGEGLPGEGRRPVLPGDGGKRVFFPGKAGE